MFTTTNCTLEARIYLAGSETVVGIPVDAVPGQTLREKRAHVSDLTIDAMLCLCKDKKGFTCTLTSNKNFLYLIPSGYIVAWASNGATSLRWGVSSDEQDSARVAHMCKIGITVFPEFRVQSNPIYNLRFFLEGN